MGVMLCGLRGTANASGRLFDAAQSLAYAGKLIFTV